LQKNVRRSAPFDLAFGKTFHEHLDMKKATLLSLAGFLFSCGLCLAETATYEIDPVHSAITFKVKHLGISTVPGQFKKFSGTFDFDPADLKKLKVNATIDTASIDTGNANRDEHLRGPEFIDVAKFPQMTFGSKEVSESARNRLRVAGDLTLHGVTKPVVLDTEFGGTVKDPSGSERVAFTASTTINRKDFGVSFNKLLDTGGAMVGDDVRIEIEIEGVKKK
jgi:polyisoprenoid-binding protein YceI